MLIKDKDHSCQEGSICLECVMKNFHKQHVNSSRGTTESHNYNACVFLTLLRYFTYSAEHIGHLQLQASSRIRAVQSGRVSTSAFVLKTTKLEFVAL